MKITLNDVTNLNSLSQINANFDAIEAALNSKVLYRANPTGEPNEMGNVLDMNGYRLYNLPAPTNSNEAARLQDIMDAMSGASSASLISYAPYGITTATNVQGAIQQTVDAIAAISGGSGPLPLGGTSHGSFVMTQSTPNQRVTFTNTNPSGWNTGIGQMSVDFELVSTNFFAANPNAHVAIVLRNTTSLIATAVRGQGAAFGFNLGAFGPGAILETWMNSAGGPSDNWLPPNSNTANNLIMQDGVTYRFRIDAKKANDGCRYMRYRIYRKNTSTTGHGGQQYTLENDTGDVLDNNTWADLTQTGLTFGYVFASNLSSWSLAFNNVTTTWGPAETPTTDVTAKMSKYGDYLYGDITTTGAQKLRVYTDATANWNNWFSVQTTATNLNSTLLVKPNGTATGANFAAVSTSTPSGAFQGVSYGIDATSALIQSAGFGGSPDPAIRVMIGNSISTIFNSNGLKIRNATSDLGQDSGTFTTVYNMNGANARYFVNNSAFDIESVCIPGTIASFAGSTYSAASIEGLLRPLYSMMSVLLGEVKVNRKIF
jgi:hypothetical protein